MRTSEAVLRESVVVQPGETRSAPLTIFGDRVSVKLSGADTGGGYALMEILTPPRVGPPLHRHSREDESFYILEGSYEFEIDGERFLAGPGCTVHAPRGAGHAFRNVGASAGRMLAIVQPAGLDDYFPALSAACENRPEPDMSAVIPIFRKCGLELLGLPLTD